MCKIRSNRINKKFSRVPQLVVGLVREKTHNKSLCHGMIKAWEKLLSSLFWSFYFANEKSEVYMMNKNWIKVFIAAFLEIFWVIGLADAYDFWTWFGTIVAIIV